MLDYDALANQIKSWGKDLGFQALAIADINLSTAQTHLRNWLSRFYHGEMAYMEKHGDKRSHPDQLVPGTLRVISARMTYWRDDCASADDILNDDRLAYISRYALGRDYHKILRHRLQLLALKIEANIGAFGYRVFCDSAPVLEKALAEKSGLGWIGKHSNLIHQHSGSWFFLGEIYTDLPLPTDPPASNHCGSCSACITACPTGAIVAPYQVDARRCISYLTIELHGSIPIQWRKAIGNRIYGCDDCQLVCPWNRFADNSLVPDFKARHRLDCRSLLELIRIDRVEFEKMMAGSPIRRIGHERWQRNLAVALGNARYDPEISRTLSAIRLNSSDLVKEHIDWALTEQAKANETNR